MSESRYYKKGTLDGSMKNELLEEEDFLSLHDYSDYVRGYKDGYLATFGSELQNDTSIKFTYNFTNHVGIVYLYGQSYSVDPETPNLAKIEIILQSPVLLKQDEEKLFDLLHPDNDDREINRNIFRI